MSYKTKAALQGRQCNYKKLKPSQITTLIDQVNSGHKLTAPLAQLIRDTRKSPHTGNSTYLKSLATWWVYPNLDRPQPIDLCEILQCRESTPMADTLSIAVQLFSSMPRDCNSFRIMRFIQAETDASPSCAKACLIPSSNAGSTRKAICLLPLPFISMVDIWLTPNYVWLVVKCMTSAYQKATPQSARTLLRRLTTNDSLNIEVAMLNHTQTRPKFQYIFTALERNNLAAGSVRVSVEAETLHEAKAKLKAQYTATFYQERQSVEAGPTKCTWRFLALHRSDRSAAPCRLSVEAFTEKEARQVLSAHFILSLAARLPVSEVRHA